jgi:hypothetical protein
MDVDLNALRTELKALLASSKYAYAMGHGCSIGDHPELRAVRRRAGDLRALIAEHSPWRSARRVLFNDGVTTERLRAELEVARTELKAHMASWEYAFAMGAASHGGQGHPAREATRRRTEALERRCRDLRAQLAEHEV